MKISLVIPVYNGEKFISRCISSIFKNNISNDNIEVIVVNDGSVDRTEEICVDLKKVYNFNLYNIPNGGVSNARNFGIDKSNYDYIMFVDADDYLNENWYDIFAEIDESYDIVYVNKFLEKNISESDLVSSILGIKNKNSFVSAPWSKLFKRELLVCNNIKFPLGVINGEDMLFNLYSLNFAKKYKIINSSFYNYYIHSLSATKVYNDRLIESDKKFHKLLDSVVEKDNLKKYMLYNGIFTISSRIAALPKCDKTLFKFAKEFPYSSTSLFGLFRLDYMSFKKKLVLILFYLHLYSAVYFVLRKVLKYDDIKDESYFINL